MANQSSVTIVSKPEKWWRTESPREHNWDKTLPPMGESEQINKSTKGVFYFGRRQQQITQYKIGPGSCHQFTGRDLQGNVPPPSISGYSGVIPGKYAGNVIGGTYNQSNFQANEHLYSTCQAMVNPDVPPARN